MFKKLVKKFVTPKRLAGYAADGVARAVNESPDNIRAKIGKVADHANAVAEFSARLSKMVRDGTIDDVEKAQLAAMAEPMFKTIMELV